jgi:TIR domain
MKVFIIGGVTGPDPTEKGVLEEFCLALGRELGDSSHQIVLCSCQPGSADRAVLEGLKGSPGRQSPMKLIVHRPEDKMIREQWRVLRKEIGLVKPQFHNHRGPDFRAKGGKEVASWEGLRLAFLLCQIKALDDCDVVLAVGGKTEGPAVLLLAVAREKGRVILPYRFLGGAAERTFAQVEGELTKRLDSDDLEKLSYVGEGAAAALDLLEKLSGARITAPARIFLSYSWRRAEYADLVEALLRRRERVTVFRDERDVRQGERIDVRVEDEIKNRCSVFLALWCREYVESPYCHDELELWIEHRGRENLYLLRFDETRPVWRSLRKQPEDRETFYALWPSVGTDREKVDLRLGDIIHDFESRMVKGPG